uniref:Pop1 N-terminal domain-containing protein n=1 Tax=Chromera velia CCMP2878 TaxID=1169474 RepID=A0A0G4H0D6_9ALVE|eukprot:Cvel_24127.t1-p1 / transcript=Cvel_24127.t1 / gene=Cvel_24127 / organism=Chromera_velia_CCMP2878 / gene_product=Ribonucleases P/MRP protein subunit POP1, putative / transcript_product=Ribonucleases P/MRP protein subunit POP1, putative / location=Cvel_scaffold2573:1907-5014(+) / protein_length=1036 / sequence_SO=supercontig / SO=protein_coding / is_pseudo=false
MSEEEREGKRPKLSSPEPGSGIQLLPQYVDLCSFVQARDAELRAFVSNMASGKPSGSFIRVFQTLDKEKRRRAMSHNPYRVPRRHRAKALQEVETAPPAASKRPRKDRRRPKNLLQIYLRRSEKNRWLESHMWHAKRMHMECVWGLWLAASTCDHLQKAQYRASSWRAVVHDRSYLTCVELRAPLASLSSLLQTCGLDRRAFRQPEALRGSRRVQGLLSWPSGEKRRICPVGLLWHSVQKEEKEMEGGEGRGKEETGGVDGEEIRSAWLFVHPAASEEAVMALCEGGARENTEDMEMGTETAVVRLLRDVPLSLLEFGGPLSQGLLGRLLTLANKKSKAALLWKDILSTAATEGERKQKFFCHPPAGAVLSLTIKIPLQLGPSPPGVTLRDPPPPPGGASASSLSPSPPPWTVSWPTDVSHSPLFRWETGHTDWSVPPPARLTMRSRKRRSVVDAIRKMRQAEEEEQKRVRQTRNPSIQQQQQRQGRGKAQTQRGTGAAAAAAAAQGSVGVEGGCGSVGGLGSSQPSSSSSSACVQGHTEEEGGACVRVPILLIFRGGSGEKREWMSGWDVLAPQGAGLFKLLILAHRAGARVLGFRDRRKLHSLLGASEFPWDFPDTVAGRQEAIGVEREALEREKKTPPAKRPNFGVLGVPFPFRPDWSVLGSRNSGEGGDGGGGFMPPVLRTFANLVRPLSLFSVSSNLSEGMRDVQGEKVTFLSLVGRAVQAGAGGVEGVGAVVSRLEGEGAQGVPLVPVVLTMHSSGVLSRGAHIFSFQKEDFPPLLSAVSQADGSAKEMGGSLSVHSDRQRQGDGPTGGPVAPACGPFLDAWALEMGRRGGARQRQQRGREARVSDSVSRGMRLEEGVHRKYRRVRQIQKRQKEEGEAEGSCASASAIPSVAQEHGLLTSADGDREGGAEIEGGRRGAEKRCEPSELRRSLSGFVTGGGHSFATGSGSGIGFISSNAFLRSLESLSAALVARGRDPGGLLTKQARGNESLLSLWSLCERVRVPVWTRETTSSIYYVAWAALALPEIAHFS